jgi:hypothetical protein
MFRDSSEVLEGLLGREASTELRVLEEDEDEDEDKEDEEKG